MVSLEKNQIKALSATEMIIHKIWCETLKTENISVTDNFFEIGGNSLNAIAIMSKIESAFNICIGLRVFFDSPRINDLAEIVDILKQKLAEGELTKRTLGVKTKIVKGEI